MGCSLLITWPWARQLTLNCSIVTTQWTTAEDCVVWCYWDRPSILNIFLPMKVKGQWGQLLWLKVVQLKTTQSEDTSSYSRLSAWLHGMWGNFILFFFCGWTCPLKEAKTDPNKEFISHNFGICISKPSHSFPGKIPIVLLFRLNVSFRQFWKQRTMGGMCEERHVLRLTFLGLLLCASGQEPVLFRAQLVEKCFALKGGKCVDFDTHSYCLRTLGIFSWTTRTMSLAGNVRTIAPTRARRSGQPALFKKITNTRPFFTHLSLRGIFIHRTVKRTNKSVKSCAYTCTKKITVLSKKTWSGDFP